MNPGERYLLPTQYACDALAVKSLHKPDQLFESGRRLLTAVLPQWEHCLGWRIVRVISKSRLREFWEKHPESAASLQDWYRVVTRAVWRSVVDVRATFRHAGPYCDCMVFNIKGNDCRLIAIIIFRTQHVYVRFVLTHREYDRGRWKSDCNC